MLRRVRQAEDGARLIVGTQEAAQACLAARDPEGCPHRVEPQPIAQLLRVVRHTSTALMDVLRARLEGSAAFLRSEDAHPIHVDVGDVDAQPLVGRRAVRHGHHPHLNLDRRALGAILARIRERLLEDEAEHVGVRDDDRRTVVLGDQVAGRHALYELLDVGGDALRLVGAVGELQEDLPLVRPVGHVLEDGLHRVRLGVQLAGQAVTEVDHTTAAAG